MKKKPVAVVEENEDISLLREIVNEFTRNHKALHIEIEKPGIIVMQSCRDDHPRIVGASGRNIQAIRTIFQFVGARRKEKLNIILNEPDSGQRQPIVPYEPNPDWKPDVVIALIDKILKKILASPFEAEAIGAKATTLLKLSVSKEDERILEILQPALQTIFHAIGRAQGHALHVISDRNEAIGALA